ncbi:fluoride efflux transporter FluC [Algiphilus sp.]|uniref:fluoride efflux transporter FluC n=1 Tax=Algiphilus sp. TaxID=1872431 RepID=UPI003B52D439
MTWAAVMFAAALGGAARYLLAEWLDRRSRSAWPWGTWCVNLLGSVLIGLLAASMVQGEAMASARWLVVAGAGLGSFTTVSAFTLQALSLWRSHPVRTVVYVAATVVLCPLAAGAGLMLGQRVLGS